VADRSGHRGGGDYVDLVRHECEFRDGKSFTFCVEAEAAAISAAHASSRVARSGPSNRSTRQQAAGFSEILDAPPGDHEIRVEQLALPRRTTRTRSGSTPDGYEGRVVSFDQALR
jgi:hypothetical protein